MAPLLAVLVLLQAEPTKDTLDVVKERVAKKEAVLVDVRELSEWKEGRVDGALFVPLSWLLEDSAQEGFAARLEEKVPKKPIVYLYCRSGNRSRNAAEILAKQGYDARSLKPGFKELVAAGFAWSK
jgi:rhodanese-related sulfurtransferase